MKPLPYFVVSFFALLLPHMVTAEERAPLKIGVIAGYSGAAKEWADYGRMALELARDEINQNGGVRGRPVELLFEDSQTVPAKAVSAYTKLATIDKVDAIIGELWAFLTNPLIPLSERMKVPTISPTVMDQSIRDTSPYFFSLGHRYVSLEGAVRQFFDLHPDLKRIGVLCWDDPWGRANLAVWKMILTERNISIS
ncbi:MAG: ABC transporter substrate-binding protein, partial [Bdellovibrionales bacterium]|nr:ABC transporter substrate-binding protein [Bdellovibrionales bacterium]